MPHGFFDGKTRFEKSPELIPIVSMVKRLHKESSDLAVDAKRYGIASLDQLKYDIILPLKEKVDAAIDAFNNKPATTDQLLHAKDLLVLVRQINADAQATLDENYDTLKKRRNLKKELTNTALEYGSWALGVVPALFMSFPAGIALVASTKAAGDQTRNLTGVNDRKTASIELLTELTETLSKIDHNLTIFVAAREPERARSVVNS